MSAECREEYSRRQTLHRFSPGLNTYAILSKTNMRIRLVSRFGASKSFHSGRPDVYVDRSTDDPDWGRLLEAGVQRALSGWKGIRLDI